MDSDELKRKLLDFRSFYEKIHHWLSQTEEKIQILESMNIIAGKYYEEGLRVRVYFNLNEEERNMLDSPYGESVDFKQGMLYYPTSSDWWDGDSVHLQYRSEVSNEEKHQHDVMLTVLHDVFWLAYDLQDEISRKQEKSPAEYLEGRIFVDKPEVWPFLPRIFRWWNEVGLPKWMPIELFENTVHEIRQHYSDSGGYIYLIEGSDAWFKIGRSKDAVKRIEKLGVVLPFPIETKHLIATDDMYRAESKLHDIFAHRRGRGEWFALNEDEVQAICGLSDIFFMPQRQEG